MAPKRGHHAPTVSGPHGPSVNLGDRLQELNCRIKHVEQWIADLHPDHTSRVLTKMLELEGNTRKLYQGFLQQAQADAMSIESRLESLDREIHDRLKSLGDHLSREADKHASKASDLRQGMRDLEQHISDNIARVISGVENRFSNEKERAVAVITTHADECVDRLNFTATSLDRLLHVTADVSRSEQCCSPGCQVGASRGRSSIDRHLNFRERQGSVIRASSRSSSRDSLQSHIHTAQSVARLRSPRA